MTAEIFNDALMRSGTFIAKDKPYGVIILFRNWIPLKAA